MVNPLGHWLWVPFCTRSQIPLRVLYRSWGIRFRITLRGLSNFRFPPGLAVPENSLLVPVRQYFVVSISYLLLWHIWVSFLYDDISGGVLWHIMTGFSFPLPRIGGNGFVGLCLWTNKISCLLLEIFFYFSFCWLCCLPLYCPLPLVWVIVGGPSLLGTY